MSTVPSEQGHTAEVHRIWCAGSKPDGQRCGARAMHGSEFCYWHDPATEAERLSGLPRPERPVGSPILPEAPRLDTVEDVEALVKQVMVYLATGERVEPRRANALLTAANHLLRAQQISALEGALAAARAENEELRQRCAAYQRELETARGAEGIALPTAGSSNGNGADRDEADPADIELSGLKSI